MANMERLQLVRDFIAKLPPKACDMTDWYKIAIKDKDSGAIVGPADGFHDWNERDMELWQGNEAYLPFKIMKEHGFACGSTACIAGWTEMMANQVTPHEKDRKEKDGGYIEAAEYLQLDSHEEYLLFRNFDEKPAQGWQAWMLELLDRSIEAGKIVDMQAIDESIRGTAIDPVCGLELEYEPRANYRSTWNNKRYQFCSEGCLDEFVESPEDYVRA